MTHVTSQVTALQNTVNGLATAAELSSLSSTVEGLASSADLATGLAALQTQIDALATSLEDVANQEDIDVINEALDGLQDDLDELLAANAVINQNISIRNLATLEYVESLISTDEDDPNVIVNGDITVEVDEDDFTADQVTRVNAVVGKLATSLGALKVTNSFTPETKILFTNLSFVDSNTTISGDTNLGDGDTENDVLRTITGNLTISNVTGDLNLSGLTSAADIVVPTGVSKLLFDSVEADTFSTTGSATGELQLFSATQIDGGNTVVSNLYAPLATDVDITAGVTATINTPAAATLDVDGEGASYGYIHISAATPTIVRLDELSKTGTLTTNEVAQLHLNELTAVNTLTSKAFVAEFEALAAVNGALEMHKIKNFKAPALDVSGVVSVTAATAITVKDVSSGYVFGAPNATSLVISALADTNTFAVTGAGFNFGKLTDLTVTGVADATPSIGSQTNAVSSTSAILVNVTTAGMIDQLKLYAGAKLAAVNTDGHIRYFELRGGGSDLTTVLLGHEHIEGSDAATLIVVGNAKLAGLTTTALDELGNITIEDNSELSSFDLSSFSTLPQLGNYTITLDDNNLSGNYVEATSVTTTTAARVERIRSASLVTLKPVMVLAADNANVTYNFTGEILSSVTTSTRSNVSDDIVVTSTNTSTLEYIIDPANGVTNSSSKVTGAFEEGDFAYVETL